MIELEPFESSDIDRLISWIPTAEFLMQWAGPVFHFPLEKSELEAHMAGARSGTRRIYRCVDRASRSTIGHAELGDIDYRNSTARISRVLIGPPEARGKGMGSSIMHAVLGVAFGELGLHRIELGVYDFNQGAIRCYEKVGFQLEGIRRHAARVGETCWNSCVMGILRHEWNRPR